MAKDADFDGVTNPRRILEKREAVEVDPKKRVDKGDLPGPAADFFKPRDHSSDMSGLAKKLKEREGKASK